jgi:hypothetical protein
MSRREHITEDARLIDPLLDFRQNRVHYAQQLPARIRAFAGPSMLSDASLTLKSSGFPFAANVSGARSRAMLPALTGQERMEHAGLLRQNCFRHRRGERDWARLGASFRRRGDEAGAR